MFSSLSTSFLSGILEEVDEDYVVFVDGMYGIAYTTDKSELRLYILLDDEVLDIDCFVFKTELEMKPFLDIKFFNKSINHRFKLMDSVLPSYYYKKKGYYPITYLKSKLFDYIKEGCIETDYIIVSDTVGLKIDTETESLCMYNVIISGDELLFKEICLDNIEQIDLLLGSGFMDITDSLKLLIVQDYFNNLN